MLRIPLNELKDKIIEKSGIEASELNDRIKKKMDQLAGLISEEGAAHIIANELGIKVFEQTSGRLQVKNILAGMRNVELVGKVMDIYEIREFNTGEREGKVGSFVVGDETGTVRIVLWNDQTDNMELLKKDMIIKIKSAYVRDNNGRKEVHLNDKSELTLNPEDEFVGEVKETKPSNTKKQIKELKEGEQNIELLGTIVQVYEPRFFEVCPTCNKRMKQKEGAFVCDAHNDVSPSYSYVLNLFLDDGTDNIRTVLFGRQTERLLEKDQEQVLQFKEFPEKFEQVKQDLLGKIVKIIGRVTKNTMFDRLEFVVQMVFPNPDPAEEIERLNKEQKQEAPANPEI
ncbi:DUF2240 family protein [Candidatus Woesearchaeota archaeon]|nr:DUF2240 family protein [Candidatus Woesearchaeota archaeon]